MTTARPAGGRGFHKAQGFFRGSPRQERARGGQGAWAGALIRSQARATSGAQGRPACGTRGDRTGLRLSRARRHAVPRRLTRTSDRVKGRKAMTDEPPARGDSATQVRLLGQNPAERGGTRTVHHAGQWLPHRQRAGRGAGLQPRGTTDRLDALVSLGIVQRTGDASQTRRPDGGLGRLPGGAKP
jgi:hypothetical protein